MRFKSSKSLVCAVGVLAVFGVGCESAPPPELPYAPAQGSVGFDIIQESGLAGPQKPTRWLATHKSGSRTAQFRIELASPQSSTKPIGVSFGKGRFIAVAGSDSGVLIAELKKALEAKTLPTRTTRV